MSLFIGRHEVSYSLQCSNLKMLKICEEVNLDGVDNNCIQNLNWGCISLFLLLGKGFCCKMLLN